MWYTANHVFVILWQRTKCFYTDNAGNSVHLFMEVLCNITTNMQKFGRYQLGQFKYFQTHLFHHCLLKMSNFIYYYFYFWNVDNCRSRILAHLVIPNLEVEKLSFSRCTVEAKMIFERKVFNFSSSPPVLHDIFAFYFSVVVTALLCWTYFLMFFILCFGSLFTKITILKWTKNANKVGEKHLTTENLFIIITFNFVYIDKRTVCY